MTREELINEIARHMGMEEHNDFWIDCAKTAIATIESSGLAIVPVDLTDEMTKRALEEDLSVPQNQWDVFLSANPLKP